MSNWEDVVASDGLLELRTAVGVDPNDRVRALEVAEAGNGVLRTLAGNRVCIAELYGQVADDQAVLLPSCAFKPFIMSVEVVSCD